MLNAVPLFVAFFVFANHYARDTIAGLAKQLIDLNIVSANTYSALNSLFFLPNIISSLIISAFVSKIGIGKCIITALVIAATGNFLFYYGITIKNVHILYVGRFMHGTMYEIIDMLPLPLLNPLFSSKWGLICGLLNSFLRLGSVFTFFLCPILYKKYSINAPFLASAIVLLSGILFGVLAVGLNHIEMRKQNQTFPKADELVYTDSWSKNIVIFGSNYFKILRGLPMQYYYYLMTGGMLYGSMVSLTHSLTHIITYSLTYLLTY